MQIITDAATRAFEAEMARTNYLQAKGEKVIAALGAVTGYHLLDMRDLVKSPLLLVYVPSWLALVALGASLILALLAMRVHGYVGYPRGSELDKLKHAGVTEDSARESIVDMLVTARERNAVINDGRAYLVRWSLVLLVLGFVAVAASRLFAVALQ